MLERSISSVAGGTLECVPVAKIHGMLKSTVLGDNCLSKESLVEGRVANAAFISDDLTFLAEVLPVVTAEAPLSIVMANVVRVR